MASGKPIIVAANERSETSRFVVEHGVGLVVPAEDPEALAGAVRYLQSHPEESADFGRNGREAVAKYFDRQVVLKNVSEQLARLAASKS
jgi:glycosyltransferase involved in cell wall biosynthesis